MRRFASCFLLIVLVSVVITTGQAESLDFLDESPEVLQLKQDLITAGYLDKSESESSLFNKKTKDAIISVQHDFELTESGIASPEMQVIVHLLAKLEGKSSAIPEKSTQKVMPDLKGLKKSDAVNALQQIGMLPVINEQFSDSIPENHIIRSAPAFNQSLPSNNRVTLFVSKGPKRITSTYSTWYAWWFNGSKGDNYDLYDPYIEDGYLYIELDATINSIYKFKWRGYGTAAIRDTFDKVVPFELKFETEEIVKGKTQKIVLEIPVKDLEVQKPTTISVKIELYQNQKTERQLRMDFTMTWP